MLKKLKIKINFKHVSRYLLFISVCFLFFGIISKRNVAQASIYPNALNVQLSNQNPSISENITAIVSVKPEELAKTNVDKNSGIFGAVVWNTTTDSAKNISSKLGIGSGLTAANPLVIAIKNPEFIVGKNHLKFSISYTTVAGIGSVNQDFQAELDIDVKAAPTTGAATIFLSGWVDYSSSATRTGNMSVNYNAGVTGRVPTAFDYDCGNGKTGTVTTTSFKCDFTTEVKNYSVKVLAKDGTGVIVSSAPFTINVTQTDAGGGVNRPDQTGPNALVALINQILGTLIGVIQEFIYQVFFYLIAPLIQAMLSIHVYTDTFAAVIYPGWEVVRNICNIFFVIALIIIAMATLFRVDSYQFRSLLVQLILAALMVNFSLVIAQAILGLADTIQAQFLPSNVEVIRSLAKDLMVSTYRDVYLSTPFADSSFSGVVKPLFFLALALGSFAVFTAIAVFLVIRIVALWVLLLISPIAYAAGALPATASYRKAWWDNFIKYAFFTPIMAFFLNLTAVIANTYKANPVLQSINDGTLTQNLGGSDIASFVFKVASNILLLVFLFASLMVAEKFGVMGAGAVTGIAKKGIFAPFGGLKIAGNYAGRRWNEFTSNIRGHEPKISFGKAAAFAVLNPVAFAKGIKKQSEERTHRAQAKAEATGLEVVEQRFSDVRSFLKGGYKMNPHVLQHEKEEEDEQAKKLQNLSREEVARRAQEIFLMPDTEEGMAYKRGVIKLAMSKGYIDDIVQEAHKTEEGRKMIDKMVEIGGVLPDDFEYEDDYEKDEQGHIKKDANGNKIVKKDANGNPVKIRKLKYNHNTRRALYKAMFGVVTDSHGKQILKDHAAMRLITQEGEKEGMDTGHLEYMTDMRLNENTGHYEFYDLKKVNDNWQSQGEVNMAAAEIAKRDSRTQAKVAWHSLMSSDGKDFSHTTFAKVAKAFVENSGFMQERTANMLVTGSTSLETIDKAQKTMRDSGNKNLVVDEQSAKRLREMFETDEAAAATVVGRFMNDTKDLPGKILKGGISINGVEVPFTKAGKVAREAAAKVEKDTKEKDQAVKDEANKKHSELVNAIKEAMGNQNGPKRKKRNP